MYFGLFYNYKKGIFLKIFVLKNVLVVLIEFGMVMKIKIYKFVKGKLVILKSS